MTSRFFSSILNCGGGNPVVKRYVISINHRSGKVLPSLVAIDAICIWEVIVVLFHHFAVIQSATYVAYQAGDELQYPIFEATKSI